MATVAECETALAELSRIIAGSAGGNDRSMRRSVACRITDLATTYLGELRDGELHEMLPAEDPSARGDITITTSSDDLVALVGGSLGFASAWGSGRVKVDASFMDLLRLRKML